MPWSKIDPEQLDIERARTILDEDHYGLEKVKRRILEFLAVRKLNPEGRSPILCFVGPPGVGKTSLGQSIAKALGLQFRRVSLGGVHDEAEIRGHRRTYIGSLPGNIVQAMRKAGRRNPVLMLDEVDKLSASYQGDPFSALLEVLDPEQNNTFRDNYLGVPFDLSKVLFIGTANVLDSIPAPLRDRMEIIELAGYTEEEKLQIARRYLLARQLTANGLTAEQIKISDEALRKVIGDYTREAGVRSLERQIGALLRNSAVSIASGKASSVSIDVAEVASILGAPRFENDVALRTSVPGVATGLAWTPAGGDILFIESSRVKGTGKLILTGQLGDVMKESAQAAVTLGQVPGGSIGHRSFRAGQLRPAHPRAGRSHPQGRPERRRGNGDIAGIAPVAAHRALRCRHDGRNQPARRRAPGRGHQGEMRGRRTCRHPHRHPAGPQSPRSRGHSRKRAQQARVRVGRADRGRARPRARGRPGPACSRLTLPALALNQSMISRRPAIRFSREIRSSAGGCES